MCKTFEANENGNREKTYWSIITCFTCTPVTMWRFGRVSLSGYIMLCGTSERMPVFPSIHLPAKDTRGQNQISSLPTHGRPPEEEEEPCTNFGHFCTSVIIQKVHEMASDEERCDLTS